MSYSAFHTLRGDGYDAMMLDTDGSELYETEYEELLGEMVKANDEWMVRQYIKKHPKAGLYPSELPDWDVILIACEHGSLDALRVLLDHYHAHINSPDTESLEQRGFSLMGIACRFAQLDTVRFLLDSQPPLGTVEPGDGWCETALLSAATSFCEVGLDWERCRFPERSWARDRMARSEGLIHLLLDRGASARDVILSRSDKEDPPQASETVLGLAIAQASYQLVARLIDAGADPHQRQMPLSQMNNHGGSNLPRDVTVLHRGGLFWNAPRIRALLDHRGSNVDIADMVSARDSDGRLPLHWAAMGPDLLAEDMLPENEVLPRIADTFKLLLEGKPSIVNIQDNLGRTAIFYAVGTHGKCSSSHSYTLARFLCENGAGASLADTNGKTVLHELTPCPVSLMLSHGADFNRADMEGSTVLHLMAKNLRQVKAANVLISRGADVNAKDSQGNTPLHTATMAGVYYARLTREGKTECTTLDERIRLHEEVIAALLKAGGSSLMDQPNAAGKSPRQLLEETRSRWTLSMTGTGYLRVSSKPQ
ncbi:ankyrin repeat-containing domain protein [Aspergillus transmontanensis]|uniref:Ankyrin repeat-containing domain protein n=1 Tax=Aspergillus transmontanensis TaxID=1034304 RepID=A0A5N6WDL3_9EURO|nr:ankyrin repeat-containing domain protein [Aspergillus transmontanensis]